MPAWGDAPLGESFRGGQTDREGQERLSTEILGAVWGWLGLCCGPIRMICILPRAMPPTEIRDKLGYANTSSTFPQGHSSPWMFA